MNQRQTPEQQERRRQEFEGQRNLAIITRITVGTIAITVTVLALGTIIDSFLP